MKNILLIAMLGLAGLNAMADSEAEKIRQAVDGSTVRWVAAELEKNPVVKAALTQAKEQSNARTCVVEGTAERAEWMDPKCNIYDYKLTFKCESGSTDDFRGFVIVEGRLWGKGDVFDSRSMELKVFFAEPSGEGQGF